VVCDATVAYGDAAADLFSEVPLRGRPLRDAAAEARWRDLVRTWLPFVEPAGRGGRPLAWDGSPRAGRACLAADDARGLYRLLTEGLPRFMAEGEVLMSEKLRGVHARPAPRVRVEARLSSGLLDLEVVSDDVDADDLLAYLAAYEARQGYVRLASGDVARVDEEVAAALAELAAGVGRTPAELVGAPAQVPANRTLFVDALLGGTPGVAFERDEAFRELAASFDERAAAAVEPPASLAGVLRPYQLDGFCWLTRLGRLGFGGILADDMGLGKTLQLIAYLVGRREEGVAGPALVVCPASLVYNWTSEIARFAPQLDAVAVTGPRTARADAIARATRAGSVLVTSYELMKRDVDLYAETAFSCLALDEAQYIKNHATQAARCAKRVPADVRFALTGTPVENRLAELWSIFDFLMPGVLGSQEAFRHRFELPIAEGDEHAAAHLQQIVAPFVLRRMKDEVLDELPEKTETLLYATLEGEQRDLYRACSDRLALELRQKLPQQFARDRVQVLAELLRLRQLCCDPHLAFDDYEGPSAKLDACLELVGNAVDSGHKVLLFSQFTSMLSRIAARLDEAGVAHFELTGATPKEERARLVEAFQAGGAPVFLISLKAGGVGLNLTAADIVVHYDPWWNLAAQNQATDRAHRIGQTNPVTVFRLIAKDTIEERIVALQEAKRDLAQSVLGGEAVGNSSLTRDDILELLGASAEIEGLGD
jgi:superfamily II DNA or RNA helicase